MLTPPTQYSHIIHSIDKSASAYLTNGRIYAVTWLPGYFEII
jgi:hypothetical protein